MKKRVLALLLCVCFVALMVPPLPARAATAAEDAEAYLKILDETKPTNSYLIDFDGDGRDELVTAKVPDSYICYCSVYQGGQALAVDQAAGMADFGDCQVVGKNGRYYLDFEEGITEYVGDRYYTVHNGAWVEEESCDSAGIDEGVFEYRVNGRAASEKEYRKVHDAYQVLYSINSVSYGSQYRSGDVRPQLEAIVEEARYADMTPGELLAEMAYAGDRGACRMTAQQAEAFAAVIEKEIMAGENDPEPAYEYAGGPEYFYRPTEIKAAIYDGGDGIPALWVCRGAYAGEGVDFYSGYQYSSVWEWDGTKAVEGVVGTLNPYGKICGDYWYVGLFELRNGRMTTAPTEWYTTVSFDPYGPEFEEYYPNFHDDPDRYTELPISYVKKAFDNLSTYHDLVPTWGKNLTFDFDNVKWDGYWTNYEGVSTSVLIPGTSYNAEHFNAPAVLEDCDPMNVDEHWKDGATAASLLRAYAAARRYPEYSYAALGAAQSEYAQVLAAVGISQATEVHRLAEGLYYVIYESGEGYCGALVRQVREKGKTVFRLERTDNAPVEQTELEPVVSQALTAANLSLDFSKITRRSTVAELRDYLETLLENMDAPTPNDPAKSELAAFLESAAATLVTQTVSGKKNLLTLDSEKVADLADSARDVYTELSAPLEDNGVTLNKTLTPTVRALWEDVDLSKPCQLELDREAARALEDCDLQLLLGDARTYLRVAAQDLTTLARDLGGSLRVQFSQEDEGVYAIRFLNADGEVVDQLSCPVTVSLPAASALDTIMASYVGGSDNWGGQYDPAAGAISFDARYSGQYEVLENNVEINDIGELSEESRAAISFMVSKGYLGVDNGAFRPGEPLTRYEFTEALVGMFFALDRELTTDFPDVEPTSRYYPYVASAQAKNIVNGYDNGTFSGEDPINREQVFALAARTLMEQKGYAQPADSEVYLSSFGDRAELSPWAAPQVALAVREGIAGRGAVLLPKANITREQAAVVLYRLFQLLYEVSPVALDLPAESGGGLPLPAVIGIVAAVVVAAGGGVTAAVLLKKKKKKTPVA